MATVADLERLKAVSDRLTPLGNMGQGEIIRAQDWNALIGTVVELARAVLAPERQVTPAPHEHSDQVSVGWLEPKLRTLVERGPLSDPAATTRVQALEQRLDRVAQRIEEIAGHIGDVRDRVTEVTSHDLIRQADITTVRRVVEGLDDSRESVRELRESLRTMQKDLTTAVTIGQRFIINGEPIDVPALLNRIDTLEDLRERLRAPNGELFDAKGFETRLTALTNTLVTQEQLDRALDTVRRNISLEELARIEGNLRTSLTEQVNTSLLSLGNEIRTETNTRLVEVDGLVSRALSDALPNLTTAILNTVRPEISTAVADGVKDSQTQFDEELNDLRVTLSADYNQKIGDVGLGLEAAVKSEFATQLPEAISAIQTRVGRLAKIVEPASARLDAAEEGLAKVANRIETVRVELLERHTKTQNELLLEIDRRDNNRTIDVNTRFAQFDKIVDRKIGVAIADNRRGLLEEARGIARDTATNEVTVATARLRSEFGTISRDSVADLVRTEIRVLQPVLTRNVATELNLLR